jgi:hypothetical protein
VTAAALVLAAASCGERPSPVAPDDTEVLGADLGEFLGVLPLRPWRARAGPPVLVGAGDIARCYEPEDPASITPPEETQAEATARLLDRIPGTVMALGDNAYEFGSTLDYLLCYQPTWGRHRERTRPAAGNHEYLTPGAEGYFMYFGLRAAPPLGYYSYDLGSWHVVVLNSTPQVYACWPPELEEGRPPDFPNPPEPPDELNPAAGRACAGDVAQQLWLAADLAAHPARCTVAYFHHPRYSSGRHGNHYQMQRIWDILYAHGVDVVVSAHDHVYERFAPQDPDANRDEARGIRQFTVGTGGAELYEFEEIQPNSEARSDDTFGVLALALGGGAYGWRFHPTTDGGFTDSGTDECH